MGIHGNATCVMAYENATGWLVGDTVEDVLAQVTAAVVDVEAQDPVGGRVQHRGERVGDRPAQDRRAQHGAHQHTPGLEAQ